MEIIVVDNASVDGSVEFIRSNYPQVTLIQLDENQGFTGACNLGMAASSGEFVGLLNNDTQVTPEWAVQAVSGFTHHERVGSVASKMLLFEDRQRIHTAGDLFSVSGCAINRGVWQLDEGQYDQVEHVFSACGGAAIYRRDMLLDVGLLDNDFYFSYEDVDLGWRAQLRGWSCLYIPQAIVYHHLSATGGGVTASYYGGRNLIYVLVKNVPTFVWRHYGYAILKHQWSLFWEALKAWRGSAARAKLRGMLMGLITLHVFLGKRRNIQQQRTVSERDIMSTLVRSAGTDT